ncbi:MAG: beta strand repeat-containing protein [Salibacteraceae bacterium]
MRRIVPILWAVLCFATFANAQITFNTVPPLNGGNGSGGTTFQVTANASIFITGFNAALQSNTQNIEIWYSTTDLTGPPNITTANWTQIGTASVTGLSAGLVPTLQTLPIPVNLLMTAGSTYRFYIGCVSCSAVYTTFNSGNGNPYSNGTITINTGTNIGYGGSLPNPSFHPRQFNGGVNYLPASGLDLAMTAITAPQTLALGSNNLTVRVTNQAADTITQADLSYSFNAGPTVNANNFVFPSPLGPGDFYDYTFSTPFNVLSAGTYNISAGLSDVNGMGNDNNTSNDNLTVSRCVGLSGTYTINNLFPTAGSNYNSFADAVADLNNCGVSGAVTFNVSTGTFNEQIVLGEIAGASAIRPITFRGISSNPAQVVLSNATSLSTTNYTVRLNGTDWVRFEDMTIQATGTSFTRVVDISNGAENNKFEGCTFLGDTNVSTTSTNKVLVWSANGNDNNNEFRDNHFHGGSYGMYWYGTTTTSLEEGGIIEDNLFEDQYFYGIRTWYTSNLKFRNNEIRSNALYTGTSYGAYFYYADNAFEATGNTIEGGGRMFTYGLYMVNCDATNINKGLVANNFIHVGDTALSSTFYGMYMSNSGFQQVVHNSIAVEGTSTSGRALWIPSGGANTVCNNVIANFGQGYASYISNTFAVTQMDNNVYYSNGAVLGYYLSNQTTFNDWQTASGQDLNSFNVDPLFTDYQNSDLHICNDILNAAGKNLNGLVAEDIDGDVRNTAAPDIGADEFNSPSDFAFTTDTITFCVGQSATLVGATDGSANLWSTGSTADSIVVNTAGNWTVTISGACGVFTDTITTVINNLAATGSVVSQVSCNGGSDGAALSTATGGVLPYTYAWSSGATTASISGLSAGVYSATVSDALGCQLVGAVTISEPAAISATTTVSANIACTGGATGAVAVSATGGTAPYTYAWSNGTTTANNTGLNAGVYTVTVSDANGCSTLSSAAITQAPAVVALTTLDSNASCNGAADGGATGTAVGGTTPYSYAWSNAATTAAISNVAAGTYTVTITDGGGCTSTSTITISEPSALSVSTLVLSNVSCNGGSDGAASALGNGGTSPYNFSWSNGSTGSPLNGLAAGTYTVTCTDANGCTVASSVTITEPNALSSSITVQDVNCAGGSNGSATVAGSGGTSPYTYAWSAGGSISTTVTNLMAGNYSLTLPAANGCSETDAFTIGVTNPAPSVTLGPDLTICPGESTTLNGGGGVISYLWSTGSTASSITVATPGMIWLQVTASTGCTASDTIQINNWPALSVSLTPQNTTCQEDNDGTIASAINGGAAPFTYLWNDANAQTGAIASNLVAGNYQLVATDANGCQDSSTANVNFDFATPVVDLGPATGVICETYSYTLSPGAGFANYLWSTNETTVSIEATTAGTYTVQAIDINGCANSDSIVLTVDPCVGIATVEEEALVAMYPNPTTGEVTLEFDGLTGDVVQVTVFTLEGQLVAQEQWNTTGSDFRGELNLSGQAQGVYLVKVATDSQSVVKRLLIQ